MFAHRVSVHLKPDGAPGFKQKIEDQVIPLLRRQAGFLHEFTVVYPNRKEVHTFSFWETAEQAEAYNRTAYPEVRKILESVVDTLEGPARVQNYEVLTSTIPIGVFVPA